MGTIWLVPYYRCLFTVDLIAKFYAKTTKIWKFWRQPMYNFKPYDISYILVVKIWFRLVFKSKSQTGNRIWPLLLRIHHYWSFMSFYLVHALQYITYDAPFQTLNRSLPSQLIPAMRWPKHSSLSTLGFSFSSIRIKTMMGTACFQPGLTLYSSQVEYIWVPQLQSIIIHSGYTNQILYSTVVLFPG